MVGGSEFGRHIVVDAGDGGLGRGQRLVERAQGLAQVARQLLVGDLVELVAISCTGSSISSRLFGTVGITIGFWVTSTCVFFSLGKKSNAT